MSNIKFSEELKSASDNIGIVQKDAIDYVSGKTIESVLSFTGHVDFDYLNTDESSFLSIRVTKKANNYILILVTDSFKLEGTVDHEYLITDVYELLKGSAPKKVVDVFERTFGIKK